MRVRWQRSDEWMRAQAIERGESVSSRAEQHVGPEVVRALAWDLRDALIDGAEMPESVWAVWVAHAPTAAPRVRMTDPIISMGYAHAPLRRDADAIDADALEEMLRAAIAEATAEADEARAELEAQRARDAALAPAYEAACVAAIDAGAGLCPPQPDGMSRDMLLEIRHRPAVEAAHARAQVRREVAEQAARQRKHDQLTGVVAAHGTELQLARWREGFMAVSEAVGLLEQQEFARLASWGNWPDGEQQLRGDSLAHGPDCAEDEERLAHFVRKVSALRSDRQYAVLLEVRAALPLDATITLMMERIECGECGAEDALTYAACSWKVGEVALERAVSLA